MTEKQFGVDRERFLFLVGAIAAQGCGGSSRSFDAPPAVVTAEIASATPAPPPPPLPAASSEPVAASEEPAIASTCDNEDGQVDCSRLAKLDSKSAGPACEGLGGNCNLLTSAYKPRVAKAIAECMDKQGRRACDIAQRSRCNRESAIQAACPDAKHEEPCQRALDRCAAAKKKPDFTKAECVRVMSSLQKRELDWAINATGPSREGCKLMFPVY